MSPLNQRLTNGNQKFGLAWPWRVSELLHETHVLDAMWDKVDLEALLVRPSEFLEYPRPNRVQKYRTHICRPKRSKHC